jgi:hypothetical protein
MMRGVRKQGLAISWLAAISSTPRHMVGSSPRLSQRLKTRLFLRLSQRLKTRLFLRLSQILKTRLFLRLGRLLHRHSSAIDLKGGQCSKLRYVDLIVRCFKKENLVQKRGIVAEFHSNLAKLIFEEIFFCTGHVSHLYRILEDLLKKSLFFSQNGKGNRNKTAVIGFFELNKSLPAKANINSVSFSDDEFVIGPCRSPATHDNDRK